MSDLKPGFEKLADNDKFITLMCPVTPQETKAVNRFIKYMVEKREKIVQGEPCENL